MTTLPGRSPPAAHSRPPPARLCRGLFTACAASLAATTPRLREHPFQHLHRFRRSPRRTAPRCDAAVPRPLHRTPEWGLESVDVAMDSAEDEQFSTGPCAADGHWRFPNWRFRARRVLRPRARSALLVP